MIKLLFEKYKNDKKVLFLALLTIVLVIALPILIVASQKSQDVRQRAGGESISLYFTNTTSAAPITQIALVPGQTTQVVLYINSASNINAFDISVKAGSNAQITQATEGEDASQFSSLFTKNIDSQNNVVQFAKGNIDTTKTIRGTLKLLTITLTPSGTQGAGTVDVINALITAPSNPDGINPTKPSISYTIGAPSPTGGTITPSPSVNPVPPSATINGPDTERETYTTVGQAFAPRSFRAVAQAQIGKTITDSRIVVVKVDSDGYPLAPSETKFECKVPNTVVEGGNGIFNTRYCTISDIQQGALTTRPISRAWTPTEQGDYYAYVDAANPAKCTGKPFGSDTANNDLGPCDTDGKDYIHIIVLPPITTTPTATPSATPAIGNLSLDIALTLQGVGKDIIHLQRPVTVQLYNVGNNMGLVASGIVSYKGTAEKTGLFSGIITTTNPAPSGDYVIKITTPRYLRKTIGDGTTKLVTHLEVGQTNFIPMTSLIPGDINGDNLIDIKDYNILKDCGAYANKRPPSIGNSGPNDPYSSAACGAHEKENADLNDDGYVNERDAQLFILSLSAVQGN